MSQDAVALARSTRNPFLLDRVDSAWEGAFTDVTSINQGAFNQGKKTIETVRETHQSRGLLLMGDPGSGKSHLLHRLRHTVVTSGHDYFVYVPPVAAAGTLFVELLRRIVSDIVRQSHSGAATQLENLVFRALLHPDKPVTPAQLWTDMRKRVPAGPALFDRLEGPFEQLVLRTQLDSEVALVLRHYLAGNHRVDAYRWLTAGSLPDDVLGRLGVTHTLEEDSDARRALFALSALAGARSVLVLAFDQLEGMQLRPDDLEGVVAFGTAVADLLMHCRNIAAVSCVQRYFYDDLKKALPQAHMDRIAQDSGGIALLRQADAVALVDARLLAEPNLSEARTALRETALWPVRLDDFTAALSPALDAGITARAVLNAARVLFDRWQTGTLDNEAQTDKSPTSGLADMFEQRLEETAEPPDEDTMADGLLKVLDLKRPTRVRRSRLRGFQIEIDQPAGVIGISICQTRNMRSLAARLKFVGDALDAKKIRRAVIIRDARLPISPTAQVTQTRLRILNESGNPLLRPSAATHAALAAARDLLAGAAAGDLSRDGRTVSPDEVRQWLLANMPTAILDLVNQLDDAPSDPTDDVLESLRAALEGAWVLPLERAAASAGVTTDTAITRLLNGQRMVGYIAGPPAVIFLRPDGLRPS